MGIGFLIAFGLFRIHSGWTGTDGSASMPSPFSEVIKFVGRSPCNRRHTVALLPPDPMPALLRATPARLFSRVVTHHGWEGIQMGQQTPPGPRRGCVGSWAYVGHLLGMPRNHASNRLDREAAEGMSQHSAGASWDGHTRDLILAPHR
jgi:hypothetical protein